jgi:HTH-type transcriptional regulator, sugar sensing transcriptional regulator
MEAHELTYLGLTEKEAKVYLAALELGKVSVQKISEKAGVNRATTYVIIESLMKKGLMSSITEDKKQFFFAEAPEKLSLLFREQSMEIQRKQEYLDKKLPELKSLNSTKKERPIVRYFEGKAGLRTMSEEFFLEKHNEPSRMIYSVDLLNQLFSEDEKRLIRERRVNNQIKNKVIYTFDKGEIKSDNFSERKKIIDKKYDVEADIAIFGNKVRIASIKNKIAGIIIEDSEIANTLKTLFDISWENL